MTKVITVAKAFPVSLYTEQVPGAWRIISHYECYSPDFTPHRHGGQCVFMYGLLFSAN